MALRFSALACAWLLAGCLYSVHHFHTGQLLPPGKAQATVGLGRQPLWRCSGWAPDTAAAAKPHSCGDSAGESVSRTAVAKGSVGFRLGLTDRPALLRGVELEWHLEGPTSPATMEFALNLGLPAPRSYHHKLGGGWGIGAWADNSFFLEYAASKSLGRPLVFANLRMTHLATQIGEVLGDDFAAPLPSHQHLVYQAGLGVSIRMPDWAFAPDYVIPHVAVVMPQVPSDDRKFREQDIPLAQWDMNLGLGWAL